MNKTLTLGGALLALALAPLASAVTINGAIQFDIPITLVGAGPNYTVNFSNPATSITPAGVAMDLAPLTTAGGGGATFFNFTFNDLTDTLTAGPFTLWSGTGAGAGFA